MVGTLLVFGLLIAPPAAALPWAGAFPVIMAGAACFGISATFVGLLLSWHLSTAAGATIAAVAVLQFLLSTVAAGLRDRRMRLAPRSASVARPMEYGHSS